MALYFWKSTRSLGPPTGRYFDKQITVQAPQTVWVLRMHQHPGLWRHATRPITFFLVVDDFGVKYVDKEHAEHLINCLKEETNKFTDDWTGDLYCGILLQWDFKVLKLDILMPGYIKKQLLKYEHIM